MPPPSDVVIMLLKLVAEFLENDIYEGGGKDLAPHHVIQDALDLFSERLVRRGLPKGLAAIRATDVEPARRYLARLRSNALRKAFGKEQTRRAHEGAYAALKQERPSLSSPPGNKDEPPGDSREAQADAFNRVYAGLPELTALEIEYCAARAETSSDREAAARLGATVGQFRVRMCRMRKRLKREGVTFRGATRAVEDIS